jgi:pimeloyl-ACP methyl ester carboxylesterase
MNTVRETTVRSHDGTTIAFDLAGQGPPVILVDGALCSRSFGPTPKLAALLAQSCTVFHYDRRGRGASTDTPPYAIEREVEDVAALVDLAGGSASVFGSSSGAALALAAAKRLPAIERVAAYEPPFIVDDSRSPLPDDYLPRLNAMIAANRPGDAVKAFMKFVGAPAIFTALMPCLPVWSKLKAAARTLPYDITIMESHQKGVPLTTQEWKTVEVPVLVLAGGKSPAWMLNATRSLADVLPTAQYRVLPGQTHMVKQQVIAPVLAEFFAS